MVEDTLGNIKKQMYSALYPGVEVHIIGVSDLDSGGDGGQCDCPQCRAQRFHAASGKKDATSPRERELREQLKEYISEVSSSVGWDDVVGNDAAREALLEAVEHPHTRKALYAHYGVRPACGAVLHGPPGCGKTMYAKAVAGALARLHADTCLLLCVKGTQIQQGYVGQTEKIIRAIFELSRLYAARTKRQAVLFIDEADALLPSRDGGRTYGYEASNVATFLAEMDGADGGTGAFVLLATNRLGAIDAAALRDGRCDRVIKVVRPDVHAARVILGRALRSIPIALTADVRQVDSQELANGAATYFFGDEHKLECTIQYVAKDDVVSAHEAGKEPEMMTEHLRLRDICSGAMMVGLAERAKKHAARRDFESGSMTGLTMHDFHAATKDVLEENMHVFHGAAVEELVQRLGETAKLREQLKAAPTHNGSRMN